MDSPRNLFISLEKGGQVVSHLGAYPRRICLTGGRILILRREVEERHGLHVHRSEVLEEHASEVLLQLVSTHLLMSRDCMCLHGLLLELQ